MKNHPFFRPFRWMGKILRSDLRFRLLNLHILLAIIVVILALVFANFAQNRLESDIRQADLALAKAIALDVDTPNPSTEAISRDMSRWMSDVWLNQDAVITVIDAQGQITLQLRGGTTILERSQWVSWSGWQRDIISRSMTANRGNFVSTAPDGEEWLNTYVITPSSGSRVIIQRPTAVAFATLHNLNRGLLIAIIIYLMVIAFFWYKLSDGIITPLEKLESFSGRVRTGKLATSAQQSAIQQLANRSDQVGHLSVALLDMEHEISDRFLQQAMLLETSRVVASSLDTGQVMDNILSQVFHLFDAIGGAIVELDARANTFKILASKGLTSADLEIIRQAPFNPLSPSMNALKSHLPVQIHDIEEEAHRLNLTPTDWSHRSILAIPLQTRHAQPAVLSLYKQFPYQYSENELAIATTFANQATVALDNAVLYRSTDERLQEQTQQLEAIIESLDVGLVLESLAGEIMVCNHQAAAWVGEPQESLIGQHAFQLLEALVGPQQDIQPLLEQLYFSDDHAIELRIPQGRSRRRDLHLHLFEVTDTSGQTIGRGQIWQDVSTYKDLDRMKSALLSTASHELRTPLTAIKGYASTLLASDVQWDEAKQHQFLSRISQESDRLTQLIKNLLDMSRIEAGTLTMNLLPNRFNDLLPAVLQTFDPAQSGRFTLDLDPHIPLAKFDKTRIMAVMRNYLENAVKYAPADQPIHVKTRATARDLFFSVSDRGKPLTAEIKSSLFDPFFREDNRLSRQVGGVGLGLAICKGFIEAHHGEVWIEPSAHGNTFHFKIPLIKAYGATIHERPELQQENFSRG